MTQSKPGPLRLSAGCNHRQGLRIADAGDVRPVADVADEAVERVLIGAGIHLDEVEAELERDAFAVVFLFERSLEGIEGAVFERF